MNPTDQATRKAIAVQREYYAETASHYDEMHVHEGDEHTFALRFMLSVIEHFGIHSILDVGSGTGRGILRIKLEKPAVTVVGIEPSAELRRVGHAKGLSEAELVDGDAMNLAFDDGAFDLVCEFGALHHIPLPSKAVSEMLRVSRKCIFISDCNNFGSGSTVSRLMKQAFNAAGLWQLIYRIKTKGKGYTISEGDGLAYSYSVFSNYKLVEEKCRSVHVLNTSGAGPNLYRRAPHVALLGVKNQGPK